MPCNCPADIDQIGIQEPHANQKDVVRAIKLLAVCCLGSIAQDTDPITSPLAATAEGFPGGLPSECTCDVLWLVQPDDTLYASHDGGNRWFVMFNGGAAFGILLDYGDPNDGGAAFSVQPSCADDTRPCYAYDSLGNVWWSHDRGTTWLQIRQAVLFAQVIRDTGLPACANATPTIMIGGSVTDGETGWYNPVTGEIEVPVDGDYELIHRVEFPGESITGTAQFKAELYLNGTTPLRESQVLFPAYNLNTSMQGVQQAALAEGDKLQYRITVNGVTDGSTTPSYFSVLVRLKNRL